MALPLVRQNKTGNTPQWRAGQGRSRRPSSVTLVAGATNVAPVVCMHASPHYKRLNVLVLAPGTLQGTILPPQGMYGLPLFSRAMRLPGRLIPT